MHPLCRHYYILHFCPKNVSTLNRNLIIAILGPTAVGKTALSIDLAGRYNTEIISADSRQCYREMSVGTAKPSVAEQALVKHHFIDSHSIHENFSAGNFETAALQRLASLFRSKKCVFLTGGSGLYADALTRGLPDIPATRPEIRENLHKEWKDVGLAPLLAELKRVDPIYYDTVDKANPMRVIRGLEVHRSTGRRFSEYRKQEAAKRDFYVIKTGLQMARDDLYARINERVNRMVGAGLFEEAEGLIDYREKQALQTVGYKEVFDYLDGHITKEEAIALIKRNTRRYAKRQLTWFAKDKDITWFQPNATEEIINFIDTKMANR